MATPAETTKETWESDSERSSTVPSIIGVNAEPARNKKSNSESHRYTSLIWEHAAQIGSVPKFEKEQLSQFPSVWKCTATFEGLSENGEGRNAKIAMHEASRKLCLELDLTG
jgi:hypothetical protein